MKTSSLPFLLLAGAVLSGTGAVAQSGGAERGPEVSPLPPQLVAAAAGVQPGGDPQATPTVPRAPRSTSTAKRTSSRDLDSLAPIVVTDSRAPRARGSEPAATVRAVPAAVKGEAAVVSVMPEVARTQGLRGTPAPTKPALETAPEPPKAPSPAPVPASAPVADGGYALHLASYRQVARARAGWDIYRGRHPDVLRDLAPRGADVTLSGKGDYVRLLVGPIRSRDEAAAKCRELKARNEYCAVMRFEGAPIT